MRRLDGALFVLGLVVLAGAAARWTRPVAAHEDEAARRHIFDVKVAKGYDYRFGNDAPFLPSNATTDNGEFLDPKSFPSAEYCGRCHREAHAQWRQSAHANSFRTPWYKKNVNLLMTEKGNEYARHCEGCHNPIALLSGTLTKGASQERPTDNDGITCSVCHSIQSVDRRGTGSYVMAQPAVLVDEAGKPIYGKVSDEEIYAHLDRHSKAVMKPFYRTSDFCGSCHKAALPRSLNDYKWQRAFSVSDEWQISSFAKQSPLPFYVKSEASNCQTCHMPRKPLDAAYPGSSATGLASHRWLGANTLIPTFYTYDEQLRQTQDFLKRDVFNIDIFALQVEGSKDAVAPLGTQAFDLRAGDVATVSVVIQNKGAAHSHVPEQRDMYESWVQFSIKGPDGSSIMESGFLKPDGELDERAHSFTNRLVNKEGTRNDLHQVWTNRVVAYNNTIQSGRSQVVRYRFRVPEGLKPGAIAVTAQVNYRRFNQHFVDFGMGRHYTQPVMVMASRTRLVRIGRNEPDGTTQADAKRDNPLWMRWNNYGIGLLDAQQYGDAVSAFEQVTRLRKDYADGFTNVALANFQWEKYDAARESLEQALKLAPDYPRALYYLALVERNQGHLDKAIEDLGAVLKAFPQSRDAHRELGFSYYQQHLYEQARSEYEAVQTIDPDDLSAHYTLAILYRRLGLQAQAATEAARFADQKDDPAANIYALEYLRTHKETAMESVPWHVHSGAERGVSEGSGSH